LSIWKKLVLVLWGSALLVFVLVGGGLLLYQNLTLETRVREIMEPYAQLVAVGAESAVAFEDPLRAQEVLEGLRANPHILAAELLLEDGRLLAGFGSRSGSAPHRSPGISVAAGQAELLMQLPRGGSLRLSMSLTQVREQMRRALWIFGTAVLVLALATLGQLTVLRRTLIRPVRALAQAAEQVRHQGEYSVRIPDAGRDEISRLARSFNAMLEAIQTREEQLRRLTRLQRTILDNAAHVIISTTPEGLVTSFNPAAERLLGYAAAEVVGKETPALWHDPNEIKQRASQLSTELGEPISPGFDVFAARPRRNLPEEGEWTFFRKNGARVPVFLSVTALRDEDGKIAGFVGLAYDLTERNRAQEAVRQINRELEQRVAERTSELEAANSELESFSYSVSHDLRGPLRAIDGFSGLLAKHYSPRLDAEGRRLISVVRDNVARMADLIDDLLQFSRTSRREMSFAPIDMRTLAQEVFNELRSAVPGRNIVLHLGDLPPASGDRAMVRQVFANLLSNAIKFSSPRAEAVIEVLGTAEGEANVYCVKDNGVGFDMQYAGKLFGVFQRLHGLDEFEGTGIGLAIVKRVIDRHGGRVWAESRLGQGSSVYFTLAAARLPENRVTR
jgi:PAS domain S-box-containing protein